MNSTLTVFIIALTTINVVGVVWLLWSLRKATIGDSEHAPQPGQAANTTGHVWDGDLSEYNNPLPRWWLWLFLITVVFALGYLVLYPGLGSWRGTLGWTSQQQYEQLHAESEARTRAALAPFAGISVADLSKNAAALKIGHNLFVNNCSVCHGSDGRGATHFPNLTDNDWLYGGDPDTIVQTISNGRQGVMIGWKTVVGDQGVEDLVAYVLSLSGRQVPAGDVAHGKELFTTNCVACHGADGKGMQAVGAPNLTDQIWLHGGSVEAIRETIANGRQGVMPAQLDRLGEQRVKLLAAYVLSLHGT